MLRLPKDWQQLHGGAATARVFKKITTVKLQTQFASCLMSAALDQFAAACLKKSGSVIKIRHRGKSKWQINDCTYKFFPVIDDDAIYECHEIGKLLIHYTLFVPPGFDSVLRNAMHSLGVPYATVFSINDYVTWRLMWDSHDFGQSTNETMVDLLGRYNDWIDRTSSDRKLLINVPELIVTEC